MYTLLKYNSYYWKYTYAGIFYYILLFFANDGAALLAIIYLNRYVWGRYGKWLL